MVAKKLNMEKIFKKIRFESNDYFPLSKPIKLPLLTIIFRYVFSKNGKFYPQLVLDDAFHELKKCCNIKKLMFQKELT